MEEMLKELREAGLLFDKLRELLERYPDLHLDGGTVVVEAWVGKDLALIRSEGDPLGAPGEEWNYTAIIRHSDKRELLRYLRRLAKAFDNSHIPLRALQSLLYYLSAESIVSEYCIKTR